MRCPSKAGFHASARGQRPSSLLTILLAGALIVLSEPRPAAARDVLHRADVAAAAPAIEAYVEKTMGEWQVPGVAIGIVADDELVYARGFGVRETGSEAPVDADTVFQIGSTTKAFLAATEAMLVDEGKLAWDDRVIDHDPDFRLYDPWVTREFRIVDLLAQRSGLPGWTLTDMMLYGYSRDEIMRALRHVEPVSSFRSTFAYQNAFHVVAGSIVATLDGADSWGEVLQKRILTPLGMTATSSTAEAFASAPNRARGHRLEDGGAVTDPTGVFPYNAAGAGAINSTVRDMSRWLRFQINEGEVDGKRLIAAGALRETYTPRIAVSGKLEEWLSLDPADMVSYASGWLVHALPFGRVIEHAGGTASFNSFVAFDPDRRFGVVVLTNALKPANDTGIAIPVGKYVLDRLYARPQVDYAAQLRQPASEEEQEEHSPLPAAPSRPLEDYAGRYRSPALGTVDIAVGADGRLGLELGPRRLPVTLEPRSGDIFVARIPLPTLGPGSEEPMRDTALVHFRADDDGRIARFHWDSHLSPGQPPFIRVVARP